MRRLSKTKLVEDSGSKFSVAVCVLLKAELFRVCKFIFNFFFPFVSIFCLVKNLAISNDSEV